MHLPMSQSHKLSSRMRCMPTDIHAMDYFSGVAVRESGDGKYYKGNTYFEFKYGQTRLFAAWTVVVLNELTCIWTKATGVYVG